MTRPTTAIVYGLALLSVVLLALFVVKDPGCAEAIEKVERTLSYELVDEQTQARYDECKLTR